MLVWCQRAVGVVPVCWCGVGVVLPLCRCGVCVVLVWCWCGVGAVRCGVVWCGVVWCGVVWRCRGVARCVAVCCGRRVAVVTPWCGWCVV